MAFRRKPPGRADSYKKKTRRDCRIFAGRAEASYQCPDVVLVIPGISPSQSAGRFHGMVESLFGATQPAKSDARAMASKARKTGFAAAFIRGG
jgi:hypothetical protein